MQDGGQADVAATGQIDVASLTTEILQNLPPTIVRVEDIKNGLDDREDVQAVGVV